MCKKNSINKKGIAVLTIILFMAFSFSCQSIKPKRVDTTSFKKGKITKVYQVQKKSGERISFDRDDPAVIIDGRVKGETLSAEGRVEAVVIPLTEIELIWVKKLNVGKTVLGVGAGWVGASLLIGISVAVALIAALG
jgi:hypothetical protein